MEKETQEQIQQLQMYEQNLQQIMLQRQQFSTQAIEIESALKELETASTSYKIIGNIMVLTTKEEMIKELTEKKELTEMRLKSLEKQEEQLRTKAAALKERIMHSLKETEKNE